MVFGGVWAAVSCVFGLVPCQYLANGNVGSIPDFVIEYAPVVYLHSTEAWFPAPISYQLQHTTPEVNFTSVSSLPPLLNLNTLSDLNAEGGKNVSLSSTEDLTKYPKWLVGFKPDSTGRVAGSPSSAFITRDLGNGTLYAFYMFFYTFNLGLLNIGNHVGDWEHFALRFDNGLPSQAWYSQHSDGSAYTYDAVPKEGKRPVVYSANGTHANYATQGDHKVLSVATDKTDNGTRWDPALAAYLIQFTPKQGATAHGSYISYQPGDTSPGGARIAPSSWLYYLGIWGDQELPQTDPRQKGEDPFATWSGGPTGPQDKHLDRDSICLAGGACKVFTNTSQTTA